MCKFFPSAIFSGFFEVASDGITHILGRGDVFSLLRGSDAATLLLAFAFSLLCIFGKSWRGIDSKEATCSILYFLSSAIALMFSNLICTIISFEFMAVSAMLLIVCGKSKGSDGAFLHYACAHFLSGVLLLVGGSQVIHLGLFEGYPKAFFMVGLLINAASFPMSSWVSHAYPAASRFGIMVLSIFTTKVAVYILLKMFPGESIVLYCGVATALYGAIFVSLERDVRRIMACNIVGQMGLLLMSVGFCREFPEIVVAQIGLSVLYQTLLFMVVDAVIERGGGESDIRKLVGVLRGMPVEAVCFAVAVLNMCALPGTAGFIVKSLMLHGADTGDMTVLLLKQVFLVFSVLLFMGVGLKFFWFFFIERSNSSVIVGTTSVISRVPILGMAFVLLTVGVFHRTILFRLVGHEFIYTFEDVVTQILILGFASLCFIFFRRQFAGKFRFDYDVDWIYRFFFPGLLLKLGNNVLSVREAFICILKSAVSVFKVGAVNIRQLVGVAGIGTIEAALLLSMLFVGIGLVWAYV